MFPKPRPRDRGPAVEATSSVIAALSRHGAEYRRRFGGSPARLHVLERLLACRTGALGGHLLVCDHCNLELPVYTSCDNRHCPQCGSARAAKWLEERLQRMLPVPHFQVVFTLPAQLRPVAHDNPKLVYALMFRVGASVLADLAEQRLGARLGITSVLHTWASNLSLHPHVHCLVTAGGLRLDGEAWVPTATDFLFPVGVIAKMYRGRLLEALIEAHKAGELRLRGEDPLQARQAFERMLRRVSRRYRQWGVHVEAPGDRPVHQALKYLARYVYRVAIGDRRMVATTDTHVAFRARDSDTDGKQRTLWLEGPEFVRRFLLHVLPKGFRKVRHFGPYAAGAAARLLAKARDLLADPDAEVPSMRRPDGHPPAANDRATRDGPGVAMTPGPGGRGSSWWGHAPVRPESAGRTDSTPTPRATPLVRTLSSPPWDGRPGFLPLGDLDFGSPRSQSTTKNAGSRAPGQSVSSAIAAQRSAAAIRPTSQRSDPVLFNSYTFLFAFLPLCWVGFRLLSRLGGDVVLGWLIGCSLVFYAWWNPTYLPLLLGSIGFNYLWGARVARTGRGVAIGVIANLGLLGLFKYTSLVVSTVQPVWSITDPELVLPLAISFFTFQQVAYIVQCARTRRSNPRLLEYMLFVCFFPQLIAGPIVGHGTFVAQLRTPDWFRVPATLSGPGLTLLVLGLFKKLVIADSFAPWANELFSDPTVTPDLVTAWRGTLAYTLQIYFDFSGYSDMALGLGRLFGVRLPENFDAPYRATSIVDFWRRWHITLSVFLRDYLYIPLGGNRNGSVRRWANLFVTMLLGGLWHGASWTFMGWGAMHGAMLAFTHMWWSVVGRDRVPRPIAILATCTAVAFAWVLFRAEDIPRSMEIWRAMVGLGELGTPRSTDLALVLGMVLCWVAPVSWRWVDSKPNGLRLLPSIGIGLAAVCALVFLKRVTPFLYFQF